MTDVIHQLETAVRKAGLVLEQKSDQHFQIKGGKLLVNYYPLSKKRTAYVDSTKQGFSHIDPDTAVQMALKAPAKIMDTGRHIGKRKNHRGTVNRLWEKQKGLCHWCSKQMVRARDADTEKIQHDWATKDHVIPLGRGGLDHPKNIVLACHQCNRDRGNDMPELEND